MGSRLFFVVLLFLLLLLLNSALSTLSLQVAQIEEGSNNLSLSLMCEFALLMVLSHLFRTTPYHIIRSLCTYSPVAE